MHVAVVLLLQVQGQASLVSGSGLGNTCCSPPRDNKLPRSTPPVCLLSQLLATFMPSCAHVFMFVSFPAGAKTTSAPSSTRAAPSVTTCPSGSRWSPSQRPVTPARSSSRACLNRWLPGQHTAYRMGAAAGASASAATTLTVPRDSSVCLRWRSLSTRHAGIRGFCRPTGTSSARHACQLPCAARQYGVLPGSKVLKAPQCFHAAVRTRQSASVGWRLSMLVSDMWALPCGCKPVCAACECPCACLPPLPVGLLSFSELLLSSFCM